MTEEQSLLCRLRSALGELQRIEEATSEPGFMGPIPYLLLLRLLVLGGIPLRFWLHRNEYTRGEWSLILLLIGLTAVLALAATWATFHRVMRDSTRVQSMLIPLDVLLISTFYFLTRNPQSDFFLFYYLPILAAAEYLGRRPMVRVFGVITGAFAGVLTLMFVTQPDSELVPDDLFLRVFLPRWVFYVSVVMTSGFLLRLERTQRERAHRREVERARLLTALGEIGDATTGVLELDWTLDAILEQLTEKLGFEFATISLVDDYRGVIETVRGKNVPPGWVERAWHELSSRDIQADIVRTGKTAVIEGWDERFDKEIYNGFGHKDLARVFAPLVADGRVVGTIEAGCRRERQAELLTLQNTRAVERIGQEKGAAVAPLRPHVLLELIACRAIEIIGADSASLHVYQHDRVFLEAGAGRATRDFLRRFPPRPDGIGRKAMDTGTYVVVDDSQHLAATHSKLYDEGIRAIAAFPLSLGVDVQGVLYVHFWKEHRFSEPELTLEEVFASQMEIAIQNSLLLRSISEAAQRAWGLTGLQNVIQSVALASSLDLTQVLQDVAQNVLYMLGADNVTLYQYDNAERRFAVPPVMKGSFKCPELMHTRVYPDDIVWRIVRKGQSLFVSDVSPEPLLSGVRSDEVDRPRFVEREGIASSAAILLQAGETGEIVGLLFANYRSRHDFSDEDRRTIIALASSAAVAIKTARLYGRVRQDLERQISNLRALSTIATRIQVAKHPLESVPRLVLMGVTAKEGLGFSRAMLFLADPEGTTLRGSMAVGSLTKEEAEATWDAMGEETENVKARGQDVLKSLLDKAEEFGVAVAEGVRQDLPLSTAIQHIAMPLQLDAGALPACVLQGRTIVVEDGQDDPLRRAMDQYTQGDGMGRTFACVPLAGIGALVVDNRFLYDERGIDDDSIRCVEAFSSVLAMSIENARLIDTLSEQQRVETWKEFTGRVAHIIGTRVAVIAGGLSLLRFHLLDNEAVKARHLVTTRESLAQLSDGIRKAKDVLNDFRKFTTPLELHLETLDVVNRLEAAVQEIRHSVGCSIKLTLPDEPLIIHGDGDRLSDAFIELIRNADDAMRQARTESPAVTIAARPALAPAEKTTVAHIEFVDNGPGVAEEHKGRIFDPFFSTKGGGSGLGLAIAKSIIEEHGGTIEEDGVHGAGARFVVRLPTLEQRWDLDQKGGTQEW